MIKKENIEILDIVKFLMSIMVVGIHTLGRYGVYPLFRVAVPLFFIISSYLFFSDFERREDNGYLKKFCVRNLKLYIFWFIVLIPVFLPMQGYLEGNLFYNVFKLVIKIFFGSTFTASWYIVALIIGVCFIFFCNKKKINHKIVFIFTFIIYMICCFNSNYRNLIPDNSFIVTLNRVYPGTIYNGFLGGLFWIYLGYEFSNKRKNYNKTKIKELFVSFLLLMIEYYIVTKYQLTVDNDCYFMLVPVCYFMFEILINCDWKCKNFDVKILRKHSTIIYCVHGSLAAVIGEFCIKGSGFGDYILKFLLVLTCSLMLSNVICLLEKKWKWLRYAY